MLLYRGFAYTSTPLTRYLREEVAHLWLHEVLAEAGCERLAKVFRYAIGATPSRPYEVRRL